MTTLTKKFTTAVGTVLGDWYTQTRDALVGVRNAEQEKRRQVEAADAEIARLLSQRAPDSEALPALDSKLEPIATAWRVAHGPALVEALAGRLDVPSGGAARVVSFVSLDAALGVLTWEALIAVCPAVRAGLAQAIASVPDGHGTPLQERVGHVAKKAEHKAALEEEHARLCDAAAELGVPLEHLDSTRSRRLVDKAAQEWRERDERDRARRVRG